MRVLVAPDSYKGTLTSFYKKFKKDLAKAGKEMQNLKEGIKTEEICDRCGKGMVIKVGKFGPFVACSGYPDCTNPREVVQDQPAAFSRQQWLLPESTDDTKFFAGLGLALVRDIMAIHRGSVELQSAPGVGTTVTLWLPVAAARAGAGAAAGPAAALAT